MSVARHVLGPARNVRPWLKVGMAVLAAATLSACSADSSRFNPGFGLTRTSVTDSGIVTAAVPVPSEPIYSAAPTYQASNQPQYAPPPAQYAPQTAYTPPQNQVVRSAALPPPPQQPQPAAYRPVPAPTSTAALPQSRASRPREVIVKQGDTLTQIARQHGVTVSQVMAVNNLSDSRLSIGQVIRLPNGASSVPDRAIASAPAPATHTVRSGESIYVIADRYNVDYRDIAKANGLERPELIQPGQKLKIPGGTQMASKDIDRSNVRVVRTVSIPASSPEPVRVAAAGRDIPIPDSSPVRPRLPEEDTTPTRSASPVQAVRLTQPEPMSGTEFRWPVRGRVISAFGPKPNGKHNDGINVAVPLGTAVKAAENGTVAYAGNELEGYGNLILVRHADGWVSAYAHNEEIMVKRGDQVRRGQVIAKAGQTGSVNQPQLHFELRKGSKPVDPLQYMAEM